MSSVVAGNLVDLVGGAEFVYELLVPLESLATVEENSVREKAVDSIQKIVGLMSVEHLKEYFVPLVTRLASRDWFTSRISSCSLFNIAYTQLPPPMQAELRQLFAQLCRDDTPMVRRAASAALAKLALVVDFSDPESPVKQEFLTLFTALADDDQDSVRLLTVESCLALSTVFPEALKSTHVLPVVFNTTSDRSWRVRWSVANKYCELCEVLGKEITTSSMLDGFEKLLSDNEPEVGAEVVVAVVVVVALSTARTAAATARRRLADRQSIVGSFVFNNAPLPPSLPIPLPSAPFPLRCRVPSASPRRCAPQPDSRLPPWPASSPCRTS